MKCSHPVELHRKITSGSIVCQHCRAKVSTCERTDHHSIQLIEQANRTVLSPQRQRFKEQRESRFRRIGALMKSGLSLYEARKELGITRYSYKHQLDHYPELKKFIPQKGEKLVN